jgi:uncharacterized protein YciI
MKTKCFLNIAIISLTILFISCKENKTVELANDEQVTETVYDSILAKEFGADQYGMKTYVIAFLKSGPNRIEDKVRAAELQKAHMSNIKRMAEEGKLLLAGPFLDNGELRGIYVFDVATLEEAKELTASDPAIQAGSLEMELKEWYGSAALMGVNDLKDKVTKIKF